MIKTTRIFFLAWILLLYAAIGSASVAKASLSASAELAQLLNQSNTLRADFKQSLYDAQHSVIQESTGSVELLRPGHFKWQIKTPNPQLLITNGKTLWIYDEDLQQVSQQSLSRAGQLSPAELLSGSVVALEKQFVIIRENNPTLSSFLLKPKTQDSPFQWVRLQFKRNTLFAMQFRNELGELSDFQFSKLQTGLSLKASSFDFKAPKGVDILVNE